MVGPSFHEERRLLEAPEGCRIVLTLCIGAGATEPVVQYHFRSRELAHATLHRLRRLGKAPTVAIIDARSDSTCASPPARHGAHLFRRYPFACP